MNQVVVLTTSLVVLCLVRTALGHEEKNSTKSIDVFANLIANWSEPKFKTVLIPIQELNLLNGIVGHHCNQTQWEGKLKQFLPVTTNPYPLEIKSHWQALILASINLDQNQSKTEVITQRPDDKVLILNQIKQFLISASQSICFTGGPFTYCSGNGTCACEPTNYIEKNRTCYGKLHANCGLGIGCIPGLQCVYQSCWSNSEGNCSSWELDPSNKVLGYCGGKDDVYFEFRRQKWPYKKFEFLMQGLIVSTVSFFGIIGNSISVMVLTRPRLRCSMSHVLLGMTISDIVYLVGQFTDTGIDNSISYFSVSKVKYVYMGDDDGASYAYSLMRKWSYFLYELGNVGSIYFTVLVSLERYIVVCHSLKAKRLCTKRNAVIASFAVSLFSLIFNFPKIFATEISGDYSRPNTTSNGRHRNSPLDRSLPNMTIAIPGIFENSNNSPQFYIMTTPFGYSKSYNLYLQWGKIIFKYFIPYYWLIFFNFWIILEVKRSDRFRKTMTSTERREFQNGRPRKPSSTTSTSSTTRMMLCVVAVFGICYLPLFIHEIFFRIPNYQPFGNSSDLMHKSIRSSVIYSFVKLFATLNSSVNFIIYCVLGEKFRVALKLMLCPWARGHKISHCRRGCNA